MLILVLATFVASPDAPSSVDATPAAAWLLEAIALDAGVDARTLAAAEQAARSALEQALPGQVVFGRAHVFTRAAPPSPNVRAAESLLAHGEERYLAFEFEEATGALIEAAGLLTAALPTLDEAHAQTLYRARLLEGITWLATGQRKAAAYALTKLLTIRLDLEPDEALASPETRALLSEVRARLVEQGLVSLEASSTPPGAAVTLDALPRGVTPMTITGLPAGLHWLRISSPGYQPHLEAVELVAKRAATRHVELLPTEERLALARVEAAARAGTLDAGTTDALAMLQRSAHAEGIVVLGVASRPDDAAAPVLLTGLYWSPARRATAAVTSDAGGVAQGAAALARRLVAPLDSAPAPRSEPLTVDFDRALLGVAPEFGRAVVVPTTPLFERWWFWVGAAVVAGSATAAALLATRDEELGPAQRVRFALDFTP